MKISNLKISNYCGIRHLDIKLRQPVLLVAGSNAAGKSSLQDAIRLMLNSDLGRVDLKKNAGKLIRDGATTAECSVVTADGDEYRAIINSGGIVVTRPSQDITLPYLLEMAMFSSAAPDDKRTLLAEITKTAPTPELIVKRLHERGCESDKVAIIQTMLRAGTDMACKHARQAATEAKGAWRAVTGETYGEKKAETWAAAKPEFDADADLALKKELDALDALLESNVRQLTLSEDAKSRKAQNATKREAYRGSAEKLSRLEKKLAADRKDLEDWTEKLEAAQEKASGKPVPKLFPCPCCNAQLYHDIKRPDAALMEWKDGGQVQDPEAAAAIPGIENSVRLFQSAVANDLRDIEAAKQAAAMLASLPAPENMDALNAGIAALQKRIVDMRADKKRIEADYRAHNDKAREAMQANGKTAKAAGYHADVCAWSKIADALSPDGIPGELLAGALSPFNERLRQSADDTGWAQVAIDADMQISANGRPYALLSESEKWRTDAMLTEAISHLSGSGLMLLDRMDVLDLPGRGDCMAWLEVLVDNEEIGTAIVCATLKAEPAARTGVQAVWLENGEAAMKEAA